MRARSRLASILLGGGALMAFAAPARAGTDGAGSAADVAARMRALQSLTDAADRTCLSNTVATETITLRGFIVGMWNRLSGAIGVTQQSEQIRGAARDLPAQYRGVENDQIRSCMNQYTPTLIALASGTDLAADAAAAWPEPIDLHLNLPDPPGQNPNRFSGMVQFNLQSSTGYVVSDRLAMQDPLGAAYYNARLRYPGTQETMRGTLVSETRDGYRTTGRPLVTPFCLQRAISLPPGHPLQYEQFDCRPGVGCQPASASARWLRGCAVRTALAMPSPLAPRTASDSPPVDAPTPAASADTRPKWVVPSVAALAAGRNEGVGYTVFTLETDLFRKPGVTAVELDLGVNGIAVLEDGLEPSERPIANDPHAPLSVSFALQTLDFAGADHGCDRVDVALRPIGAGGARGAPVHATLRYVALRDVLTRSTPLGEGSVQWSAGYVIPAREWRAIAELGSYIYAAADAAGRDRAAARAVADKAALDALRLSYNGQTVVGVVRPPRTIQPNGTAAFGLAAGLVQPNGQIRFTFSAADETALASYLYALSARRRDVAAVVTTKPFLFQANGAARTVPGVCETPR